MKAFTRSQLSLTALAALSTALLSSADLVAQQDRQKTDSSDNTARSSRRDERRNADNRAGDNQKALPQIRFDRAPLPPDVKARTSYAPVAKKVAASVVNVYSTRTVKNESLNPFMNDPLFRRFFGGPRGNRSPRSETQRGLGSGVIVSEDGYILTNNHVVEDASDIRVALSSGEEFSATVVGTDPATDVAVLKVDRTGLPAITLTDSTQLEVGDTVLAVGNPFGVGQTVTVGIVSGLGRSGFGIVDYEDFIQTDASINPGNSGGALTDVLGRLIGINTAILSRTGGNQGVGFAIPVEIARNVMDQIIQTGHVVRGYLGLYIQPLTPDLAREFKVPEAKGALVSRVSPRSPAAKAGIKEGDVITEFQSKPVVDSAQFRLMVAGTAPGTKADMNYVRGGEQKQTTVTLGELPTEELAQARGRSAPESRSGQAASLEGLQVSELDAQTRREFNVPNDVKGVVVTDVELGSAAERAGLEPGDVIEDINRQPIDSMRDATSQLRKQKDGSILLRVWSNGGSHYVVLDNSNAQPRTRSAPAR
jgi:serine protease Do